MTKQKIIDTLYKCTGIKEDMFWHKIADTLLAMFEQEKKEQAREIIKIIIEEHGVDEEFIKENLIYDINGAYLVRDLCERYGVEL